MKNFRSNICFSGISSSEHNFYGHWRSSLGLYPPWSLCLTYFDTHDFQAAKDASSSQDKLIVLFNHIERFFGRLEIYTGLTPTVAMTNIIVEIMVEVLTILAIATKEVKRGRLSELIPRRFKILD